MIRIHDCRESLMYMKYHPSLDEAIENFKDAKTVKVYKGNVYVQDLSKIYFIEILLDMNVKFELITKI